MIRKLRNRRGQSTLEYAILIVVVIMALIGIQAYLKRALEGRGRESADQIGQQFSTASSSYNLTTDTYAVVNETSDAWGSKTNYVNQSSTTHGTESIGNFETEYYLLQH